MPGFRRMIAPWQKYAVEGQLLHDFDCIPSVIEYVPIGHTVQLLNIKLISLKNYIYIYILSHLKIFPEIFPKCTISNVEISF